MSCLCEDFRTYASFLPSVLFLFGWYPAYVDASKKMFKARARMHLKSSSSGEDKLKQEKVLIHSREHPVCFHV